MPIAWAHTLSAALATIVNHPAKSQIDDLLPWAYAARHQLEAAARKQRLHSKFAAEA